MPSWRQDKWFLVSRVLKFYILQEFTVVIKIGIMLKQGFISRTQGTPLARCLASWYNRKMDCPCLNVCMLLKGLYGVLKSHKVVLRLGRKACSIEKENKGGKGKIEQGTKRWDFSKRNYLSVMADWYNNTGQAWNNTYQEIASWLLTLHQTQTAVLSSTSTTTKLYDTNFKEKYIELKENWFYH